MRTITKTILEVQDLVKHFPITSRGIILKKQVGSIHAVDGISFSVNKGETFGLVGESGCGKTTTARSILYLDPPTSGKINFEGKDLVSVFKSKDKRGVKWA